MTEEVSFFIFGDFFLSTLYHELNIIRFRRELKVIFISKHFQLFIKICQLKLLVSVMLVKINIM